MDNMADSYKEEVKSLIKTGKFDLELISFEYGIPMDIILKWKNELERENQSSNRKINSKLDEMVSKKANELKERYMILYNNANSTKKKSPKEKPYYSELSEQQKEALRKNVSNMQSWVEDLDKNSNNEDKIAVVKNVIQETLKLNPESRVLLPIDIVEGYIKIIFSSEIQNIMKQGKYNGLIADMTRAKSILARQLVRSLEGEVQNANDIESLRKLASNIRPELVKASMLLDATKMKIDNKIRTIQQSNLTKNNISPAIESIVIGLTNGNLDIDAANVLLDNEAKQINEKRPKNFKFAVISEEQDRKQILMQLKMIIREQGDQYPIKNVDSSIAQIMKLCNIPIEQAVTTVVEQAIKLKEFEKAREICSKYGKLSYEMDNAINQLLKKISSAERSDIVLRGLRDEVSPEEEEIFLKIIEGELVMEKATRTIRLEKLDLGMNKEKTKKITFGDVWSDERVK